MKISVPKETHSDETRTPLTPNSAAKLVKLGAQVEIEASLGGAKASLNALVAAVKAS